jgi:hypothetical protein
MLFLWFVLFGDKKMNMRVRVELCSSAQLPISLVACCQLHRILRIICPRYVEYANVEADVETAGRVLFRGLLSTVRRGTEVERVHQYC